MKKTKDRAAATTAALNGKDKTFMLGGKQMTLKIAALSIDEDQVEIDAKKDLLERWDKLDLGSADSEALVDAKSNARRSLPHLTLLNSGGQIGN